MTEITFRSDVSVDLMAHMGTEADIVHGARLSTKGAASVPDGESKGLIRFLIREGHTVPLEHCVLSFRFEVPIFVSRQIVKYTHSRISEESGRYKELEPVFYVPAEDRPVKQVGKTGDYRFVENPDLNEYAGDVIADASHTAWWNYESLLREGVAKEVARMVLPVNTYSTMRVTGNLVHWLHFCHQRMTEAASHGQVEIAMVADKVGEHLAELYPTVWDEFVKKGYSLK